MKVTERKKTINITSETHRRLLRHSRENGYVLQWFVERCINEAIDAAERRSK